MAAKQDNDELIATAATVEPLKLKAPMSIQTKCRHRQGDSAAGAIHRHEARRNPRRNRNDTMLQQDLEEGHYTIQNPVSPTQLS